ncbi:type II CRISPR RNA-guided endonuclease Cas9 [Carnobacteriaceae bacterium zg-C25]|nr:type II CRISPR RNA-guided endonuclease Cas9 [Carnobacteriaceae bacterium zg-C25]
MSKKYSIGLDIGVGSVGYAVVMDDYRVPVKKIKVLGNTDKKYVKKSLMGSSLFEPADTAAERRIHRTTRRRYNRRRNRLLYLQDIFAEEMMKVDKNFFHRLSESFLQEDDKKLSESKYPIFATLEEERHYHKTFKTIYHLREYLANTTEKADLRLVYLAIAHILKYRGHFLLEGALDVSNIGVQKNFEEFLSEYEGHFGRLNKINEHLYEEELTRKLRQSKKVENMMKFFPDELSKSALKYFVKLIIGNKVDFKTVFKLTEKFDLQFSSETYEEEVEALLAIIGLDYEPLFEYAKKVYESILLFDILRDSPLDSKAPLSSSMVVKYHEHHQDLKDLKQFFKLYLPDKYGVMFKDKSQQGYAGYISGEHKKVGSTFTSTAKPVSQEAFYKYTEKLIDKIPEGQIFIDKIKEQTFLNKQRSYANGVIPHQIHLQELEAILESQGKHYPFLKDNADKIKQILTFRIPYYVGPLANGQSEFAWLSRKSNEPIRPWNFEEIVNEEESAKRFIEKMTLFDTYLPDCRVLPKHSLIYEKYMVFNELTKVRFQFNGGQWAYLSTQDKQKIFDALFKKYRKVTYKQLIRFMENELQFYDFKLKNVQNDAAFNASYSTYIDLLNVFSKDFLDDVKNEALIENVIHILTIFDDRKMIEKQLFDLGILDDAIIKKLSRKKFTGWGRLSKTLLHGIRNKENGKTILDYLIDDELNNRNFMQLIRDTSLSFKEEIEKAQVQQLELDNNEELVASLSGSPAIKKGILQSLKIVDEIIRVMGNQLPENIVIEMAKEHQTTKKGKDNSKKRYETIEKGLNDLGSELLKQEPVADNRLLHKEKLFLYYLQNGKDLYTGKDLDINFLSQYHVDHIVPRSFIKDDSVDNKVLTSAKENAKKTNDVLDSDIVRKESLFWKKLHAVGLISDKKLSRLMKQELTVEDKMRFIQRQIVETRQITKHVARLLDDKFNKEIDNDGRKIRRVKVMTVHANIVSRFRRELKLYKLREVNPYHHAHDAYLLTVVADVLLKLYPQMEKELVYGSYIKHGTFDQNGMKATQRHAMYNKILSFMQKERLVDTLTGEVVWDKEGMKEKLGHVIYNMPVTVTKKTEIQTGRLYKESNKPAGYNNKLIDRKQHLNAARYGGFIEPTEAYAVFVKYVDQSKKKPKEVSKIIGINLLERMTFEKDERAYLTSLGFENIKIWFRLPKYSLFEFENGRRRLLATSNELQKGNYLRLDKPLTELLYHAVALGKTTVDSEDTYSLEENRHLFDTLFERVVEFNQYLLIDKSFNELKRLYDENKNSDIEAIAESFVNLMTLASFGAPADFKFFDTKIVRTRYTSISECYQATLIYQSVTGLYETRIDLGAL